MKVEKNGKQTIFHCGKSKDNNVKTKPVKAKKIKEAVPASYIPEEVENNG